MTSLTRRFFLASVCLGMWALGFRLSEAQTADAKFQFLVGEWKGEWKNRMYHGTFEMSIKDVTGNIASGTTSGAGGPSKGGEEQLKATVKEENGRIMLTFSRRSSGAQYLLNVVSEKRLEGTTSGGTLNSDMWLEKVK